MDTPLTSVAFLWSCHGSLVTAIWDCWKGFVNLGHSIDMGWARHYGTGSSSRAPSDLKLTFLKPSMGLVIARSPPCHNLLRQLGHLCLIATRCRTRTGFGSSFKVEFGSGGNRHTSISGGEYLPLSNIQGIGGSILPMLSHGLRFSEHHAEKESTKAQTLSPGTSRLAHIESRSAQVFILEPFLKDVSLYNKP
ncbi:unnamed protein product [Prunus armeniaca]